MPGQIKQGGGPNLARGPCGLEEGIALFRASVKDIQSVTFTLHVSVTAFPIIGYL